MTLKTFGLVMLCIPLIAFIWYAVIWGCIFLHWTLKEEHYNEQIAAQQFRLNQLKLEGEEHEETTW